MKPPGYASGVGTPTMMVDLPDGDCRNSKVSQREPKKSEGRGERNGPKERGFSRKREEARTGATTEIEA